jgi:hypothetical protein
MNPIKDEQRRLLSLKEKEGEAEAGKQKIIFK